MSTTPVYAVANQNDAIECQPRLGTVPGDKLFDCVLINPPRVRGGEAIQYGQFGVIEIG